MRSHTNQPFPRLSWISLIKISCHVNGLRQSYAEWGHPLPNWGCHRAVPCGKKWPLEGSCHHSHAASTGAGTACPMPHLGTLCTALSNGVRGWNTHKAVNSLSEEPLGLVLLPRLYQNDLHGWGHTRRHRWHQTRLCHQVKRPNWFGAPECSEGEQAWEPKHFFLSFSLFSGSFSMCSKCCYCPWWDVPVCGENRFKTIHQPHLPSQPRRKPMQIRIAFGGNRKSLILTHIV